MEQTESLERAIEMDRMGAMQLFKRYPVAFVRGSGSYLWDTEGRRYLDLLMGIAVCGLGHCHPRVVKAIQDQVGTLMHTTNLFYIPKQAELAERLHSESAGFMSYFANSGSEANECAMKLVRKYGMKQGRWQIITSLDSFHGRTLAAISATGQEKVRKGFGPLMPGFSHVPHNDLPALEAAITPETAAIMLEVVQAESYNTLPAAGYLQGVREICDRRGLLLVFDEVQTGIARSGRLFAWQRYNVRPDIFTLAKALGNGIPVSACLATPEVAAAFEPGDHGGTYGGNPVACAAALAVLDTIRDDDVLEQVVVSGAQFTEGLREMQTRWPQIREIRSVGLLLAFMLDPPVAREVTLAALDLGPIINATSEQCVRLRPALNISSDEIDSGLELIEASLKAVLE